MHAKMYKLAGLQFFSILNIYQFKNKHWNLLLVIKQMYIPNSSAWNRESARMFFSRPVAY